jgi:hypothetical protein
LLSGLSVLVRTWKLRELERCERIADQTHRIRYADRSNSHEHSSGPHSGPYKSSRPSHGGPYKASEPSNGGADEKSSRPSTGTVSARRWAS